MTESSKRYFFDDSRTEPYSHSGSPNSLLTFIPRGTGQTDDEEWVRRGSLDDSIIPESKERTHHFTRRMEGGPLPSLTPLDFSVFQEQEVRDR